MSSRPKILYVIRHAPYPTTVGVQIRTGRIGEILQETGTLTTVLAPLWWDDAQNEETRKHLSPLHLMRTNRTRQRPFHRILRALDTLSPWSLHGHVSREDRRLFDALAAEHDVVWFERLTAAMVFGCRRYARSIMDLDDIMSVRHAQQGRFAESAFSRCLQRHQAWKNRRFECRVLENFDLVGVCSDTDKTFLGGGPRIHVIPNGFDLLPETPRQPSGDRIGFIGALGYQPNAEGLAWFFREIWPHVRQSRPDVKVRVIGRIPPTGFPWEGEGIEPLGFVEDPGPEMATWAALIVPLRIGGGTRIKILEAFSRRCPVVSTALGAHGLGAEADRHLLLADEPEAFARQLLRLLAEPPLGDRLAREGREFLLAKYTWDRVAENVRAMVHRCLESARQFG